MAKLSIPPGLPSALAGFLDLRGTAVPIVRMDRLFALPEQEPGLHTPMIVLRGEVRPVGILVGSVQGIEAVPGSCLLKMPEGGSFQGCAVANLQLDGDTVHVLSGSGLLAANETSLLADYGAMSQARLLTLEESV